MFIAIGLVDVLGALVGLLAMELTASGAPLEARFGLVALASCCLALLGGGLVASRRPRVGALLTVEALLGLWVGLGAAALFPVTLLLLAAWLAWLQPAPRRRPDPTPWGRRLSL